MSWGSKDCNRPLDLIEIIVSWEQWRSAKELCEDAAYGPNIQGVGVMGGVQDDLGSSVPSGNHVFCERGGCFFVASSQTKIANFQVAVFVQQQITWLQISMNDIGGVNVKAASE